MFFSSVLLKVNHDWHAGHTSLICTVMLGDSI